MKLENYNKVSQAVQEIDMLMSARPATGFDFMKAMWIITNSDKYEDLKAKINDWATNEIMPFWDKIIADKIKQLEEL